MCAASGNQLEGSRRLVEKAIMKRGLSKVVIYYIRVAITLPMVSPNETPQN